MRSDSGRASWMLPIVWRVSFFAAALALLVYAGTVSEYAFSWAFSAAVAVPMTLIFVFQIDVSGMSWLSGAPIHPRRARKREDGETTLQQEWLASGEIGDLPLPLNMCLHVRLTNRRLLVRFNTSFPGLALIDLPLEALQSVDRLDWELGKPVRFTYECGGVTKSFQLYSDKDWVTPLAKSGTRYEGMA